MTELTINTGLIIALGAFAWLIFKVVGTLGTGDKNTTAANMLRGGDGSSELVDDQAAFRHAEESSHRR